MSQLLILNFDNMVPAFNKMILYMYDIALSFSSVLVMQLEF